MSFSSPGAYKWILMLAIVCFAGWLWISWVNGWHPFSTPSAALQEGPPAKQDILNSLTAPEVPVSTTTTTALKGLTSAPATKTATATASAPAANSAETNSILDSLTPKK